MLTEEMQMMIEVLVGQGRVMELIDLKTIIRGFEQAESFGPYIDPSAFVRNPDKFGDLAATKHFVEAAFAFQQAYAKYKGYVMTRAQSATLPELPGRDARSTAALFDNAPSTKPGHAH